ncbi:MAG: aldehyde dehydrogenase family protein [Caldilineaceae bacterium]
MALSFKVTYATISADNEELQSAFDDAIATVKGGWLGAEVPMFINGKTVHTQDKVKSYSPIDRDILMCTAQNGDVTHADAAIAAAKAAFPTWSHVPWQERVAIMRKLAEQISDNGWS